MDNLNSTSLPNSTECPSIDDFRNQVYSTVYSLITVFALLSNGLALIILIRTNRHSTPFHIYMLNLAVSDILCACTLPLRILYYVNKGQWNYGDFLCRFSSYSLYVNLYCSIYFMAVMSVTRFLAIVFPVKNMYLVTEKRARIVCFGVWVLICLMSCPFLLSGQHIDPVTNKTKCFEPPKKIKGIKTLVRLNYVSLAIGFLIPFLVILICYVGIIRTLMSRTMVPSKQTASATRAIRMIVIVLLTFLLCFMPYHIQRTIHLHFLSRTDASCEETVAMQKYVVITLCLAASNSCFDPMLYFFSGEGFRTRVNSFRQSFRGKWTFRENPDQQVKESNQLNVSSPHV
ncbi:cysteinyl leukotriene receptor 1 [Boleophthalmus pectinirostris]|uniref:cysteinyl leukotriene receptor 1 n=1 Tax=Boleophthalmus pectinirostris TaxID=150288 RepID=UPI000A1C3A36|nr:cysteinyl leukotriene receptor 1 [Boleophthalmus pectinirostris]XP_020773379.1 cysteinyl leukotriene receptor 1 [Boleophthalmus pectinirostris]XP_055015563.1 cysteinyl leukotriene receptor 1 [Boleophthalmus pectinirostris]